MVIPLKIHQPMLNSDFDGDELNAISWWEQHKQTQLTIGRVISRNLPQVELIHTNPLKPIPRPKNRYPKPCKHQPHQHRRFKGGYSKSYR